MGMQLANMGDSVMNRLAVFATFFATIGATLALTGTSASAGKPPPQPPPNPCIDAQSRGFPAMVFTRKRTTSGHVYVDTILSDPSGQCQQTIFVADGFAPSYPGSDVNLRYGATTGAGLIVRGGGAPGVTFVVSRFTVTFDATGVPTVSSGTYSTALALADLTTPTELAGWDKYVLANPLISPDGNKMLAVVAFRKIVGTVETVKTTHWTCPFDSLNTPPVVAASCQMRYSGSTPGESSTAGWGGLSDSIYITDAASGGSGRSLYRLQLVTPTNSQTFTEVWSLGTMFRDAKASLNTAGQELVAVYESGRPGNCTRILVIDAGTCPTSGCQVVNGDGSPALSIAWLPGGRVAGEGRTAPDRKGQCSSSGSIVTFDPYDTNGITTTITPAGSFPDGAGGG